MRDGAALRIAVYRLRATFSRRWPGYLAIVLLIGGIGGLAMGAVAAARRTQSSFSTFLGSTNPTQLTIAIFPNGSGPGTTGMYSPTTTAALRHLSGVEKVESWVQLFALPLPRSGRPDLGTISNITPVGSVNGLSFDLDRPGVIAGRMPNPKSPTEFVTTPAGAQFAGWHLGEVVPYGFYTINQISSPQFVSGAVAPALRLNEHLVGIVQFSDSVVQDEVDRYPTFDLFTPALTDELVARGMAYTTYDAIKTAPGALAKVEQGAAGVLPKGIQYQEHVASLNTARTDRAIKPESIALGAFGLIAALAALAIAGQAIARSLRARRDDLEVLRALGASPLTLVEDGLLGVFGSLLIGTALAVGVAICLSPIGPIGPVRAVYPDRGFAADWTVLGLGAALFVALLSVLGVVTAVRVLPQRRAAAARMSGRRQILAGAAATAGLPPPVIAGVRFALEPSNGRASIPVRSALFGTALAVVVVVATLTFGSGLSSLVTHPPLYGWNWDYALFSESGPDVPPQAVALLARDHDVAAYSTASTADPSIDGQSVPALFEPAGATVVPPILSGHEPDGPNEIVLGAATMAELGTHVGGTVTVTYGSPKDAPFYVAPITVRVVGTATFPAIGFPSAEGDHTSMGSGALVPISLVPAAFRKAMESPDPTLDGPEYLFVRMRPGLGTATAQADMQRIARAGNLAFASAPNGDGQGDSVLVFSDLLPAEIANYKTIGATPALLAGSLAVAAVVALGLTLVASVRRSRRDLALLKSLGFTGRQITESVAVQATVVGIAGLGVGIPIGIALGRWLWDLFAHEIYAVPAPSVPAPAIVLVAVAALVLVNAVAVLPGRVAARTPTALVLRAE